MYCMYLYVFVFVLATKAVLVASLLLPTSALHYQTLTLLVFYHWPAILFFSYFTLLSATDPYNLVPVFSSFFHILKVETFLTTSVLKSTKEKPKTISDSRPPMELLNSHCINFFAVHYSHWCQAASPSHSGFCQGNNLAICFLFSSSLYFSFCLFPFADKYVLCFMQYFAYAFIGPPFDFFVGCLCLHLQFESETGLVVWKRKTTLTHF